ncbi:4-alpha-glucanotransferase [Corynebacterium diphtheriae]
MSYSDLLRELAAAHAISSSYSGFGGAHVEVSDDTLVKTLRSLGVCFGNEDEPATDHEPLTGPMPSEDQIRYALQQRYDAEATRPLPRCVVAVEGDPYVFNVHVHDGAPADITITLEDGSTAEVTQVENWAPPREVDGITWGEASFQLPSDLPLGWHTITLTSDTLTSSCFLIVTPARLSTADKYAEHPVSGVMAQLYSARSKNSWGMGDFNDLGLLAETLAPQADYLLINPLHAAEPMPPVEDSPYLPTTRRFINPIYIRIEDIPEHLLLDDDLQNDVAELAEEFTALNLTPEKIERNPIFDAKLQVLHAVFNVEREPAREQDFQDFIATEGQGLRDFASWCADQELAVLESSAAHAALPEKESLIQFYMWQQWICDQQLGAAQTRATDAGMSIGIIADLAVGIHPAGADALSLADTLVARASVGAPPDSYNHQGQDWSQPPWHPDRLAESGYIPWRDLLRTVLRHAGGVRVDHILGLFRLFWIPRTQSPQTGTYVNYDHNALVGVLALEAERAGAVVIGEDLGTFEPWVQDFLASRGIMGTSVLWFESSPEGGPHKQHEYRQLALTSVTTHDLPPTAGYLAGEHIALREELGILTTDVATEYAEDLNWQADILNVVRNSGAFESIVPAEFHGVDRADRGSSVELLSALHRFLAGTPSALTCTALVDLVADKRAQNQPGTTSDQYPNWCIPLCDESGTPVLIEDLAENPVYQAVTKASTRLH